MNTLAYITPTIGSDYLGECIDSIAQTGHKHLVVCDGREYADGVTRICSDHWHKNLDILVLPYNTGMEDGRGTWFGLRIYASIPFLVNTDYFCVIDDDNKVERYHAERMMESFEGDVVSCRRYIMERTGEVLGVDNVESVGWNGTYHLNDGNTLMFKTSEWYKYAGYIASERWSGDRVLSRAIEGHKHIEEPLVYYRSKPQNFDFFKWICSI